MRTWGKVLLIFGILAIVISLGMDTSVAVGSGRRVHNLGLMRDQSNIMNVGILMAAAGLMMLLFGNKSASAASSSTLRGNLPESAPDPFDELEESRAQAGSDYERKKYAISIGVERAAGYYWVNGSSFQTLEEAIAEAEKGRADTSS